MTNNSISTYGNLSDWVRSHAIAASLIVLFCSTSVRLFLAWRADPLEMVNGGIPDSTTYLTPARKLLEKGAFINAAGKAEITRTPGYPAFLAALMIVVGQDLREILLVQAVILSTSVVILYWLARRILPPLTACLAGLLAAFSPWGAVLAGLPLTDGLYLLLLALIFLTMKLTAEANNRIAIAVGSACTGLLTAAAVLVRPAWPLVLLIAVTFFLLYGPKRKGVWLLLAMTLAFAVTPLFLWKARNQRVSQFNDLSDIAGKCASLMLVSRVTAHVNNQDKWVLVRRAQLEEKNWKMSIQQADRERWGRAKATFIEHPVLTGYYFLLSSTEHAIHPDPTVLSSAKLNFYGDYGVFALLWGGLLVLACLGWQYNADPDVGNSTTNRNWLSAILLICVLLTLSSGLCFGAGSRYRVPLELIVPLLAASGLVYAFDRSSRTI